MLENITSRFGSVSSNISHRSKEFFGSFTTVHYVILALILLIIVFVCLYFFNDDFKNFVSSKLEGFSSAIKNNNINVQKPAVDNLQILYFYSETCPYCIKMSDVLKQEGSLQYMQPVDINTELGQKLMAQYGVSGGVPAFVSLKTGTMSVGFKPSTNDVVASLLSTDQQQQGHQQQGQDQGPSKEEVMAELAKLEVVLFKSKTCGHCKKALADLDQLTQEYGQLPVVVYDINDAEGRQVLEGSGLPNDGRVPMYWSKKNGTHVIGHKPFNQVLISLSQTAPPV